MAYDSLNEKIILFVGRLVERKGIKYLIKAFAEVKNKIPHKLVIIGDGPERKNLQQLAKANIKFLNWLSPEKLLEYYSSCQALIFPGEEDFGIVPVGAQLCGKPVIAYQRGGVLETVIGYTGDNESECSGIFFKNQNEQDLENAVKQCQIIKWNPDYIYNHAL